MDELLAELEAATASLKKIDAQRAGQMAYRDDLVRRAKAAGATWPLLQQASGMSPRGVQQALKR